MPRDNWWAAPDGYVLKWSGFTSTTDDMGKALTGDELAKLNNFMLLGGRTSPIRVEVKGIRRDPTIETLVKQKLPYVNTWWDSNHRDNHADAHWLYIRALMVARFGYGGFTEYELRNPVTLLRLFVMMKKLGVLKGTYKKVMRDLFCKLVVNKYPTYWNREYINWNSIKVEPLIEGEKEQRWSYTDILRVGHPRIPIDSRSAKQELDQIKGTPLLKTRGHDRLRILLTKIKDPTTPFGLAARIMEKTPEIAPQMVHPYLRTTREVYGSILNRGPDIRVLNCLMGDLPVLAEKGLLRHERFLEIIVDWLEHYADPASKVITAVLPRNQAKLPPVIIEALKRALTKAGFPVAHVPVVLVEMPMSERSLVKAIRILSDLQASSLLVGGNKLTSIVADFPEDVNRFDALWARLSPLRREWGVGKYQHTLTGKHIVVITERLRQNAPLTGRVVRVCVKEDSQYAASPIRKEQLDLIGYSSGLCSRWLKEA